MSNERKLIDFMGLGKIALVLSAILLIVSIAALMTKGLNFGIDFTGGTVVEVAYPQAKEPDAVRSVLESEGFDAVVQHFGSAQDLLIRLPPVAEATEEARSLLSNKVLSVLQTEDAQAEMQRVDFVGPGVGEELREQGGLGMLIALGCILIYVALRFEWRFSLGAVAALIHDVLLVLGFFAITQIEFDLSVLAAVLAVIGYSLNDTIVVFDRQRENFRILRTAEPMEVLNVSINQTLARTLITSLTTLMVVCALYIFGSDVIAGFSIALMVGILVGTYSSIYVASNTLLRLGITKEALLPPERDEETAAELDALP